MESRFGRAWTLALQAIGRRSYSVAQLRTYLTRKGIGPETIEAVLSELQEKGYLDDRTYATFFASDAVRLRRQGRRRIDLELEKRGISPELREEILAALFSEHAETDVALSALAKRFSRGDLDNPASRNRAIRFLQRKGFGWDVIREALERLES